MRVEHLSQCFGKTKVVDDVSFDIRKGEVLGLVGESGCGKTTTGRCIMRLYPISDGKIFFKECCINAGTGAYYAQLKGDPAAAKRLRRQIRNAKNLQRKMGKDRQLCSKIQMIFQDPVASLDPRMTVGEIISEGLVINGLRDRKLLDEKVREILHLVGLRWEHAGRYPHEFSGGQRQRIGIARAVIMEPELLIADEPVSALDVSIQAQVIELLAQLRQQLGLSMLFIAHDLSVVKYVSDRIGVMYRGKLVELADAEALFQRPLHPYTRALLSAVPVPDPQLEKQRRRIHYDPNTAHDYRVDLPSWRQVAPEHFVYCNDQEEKELFQ